MAGALTRITTALLRRLPHEEQEAAVKAAVTWSSGWRTIWGVARYDAAYTGTSYDVDSLAGDLRYNAVVAACLACLQRSFPEPKLQVLRRQGDQEEPVPDHPLLVFLRRPNPYFSLSRMWEAIIADLPTGNGYWLKERTRGGDVARLLPACADDIYPDWPHDGAATRTFISRYIRKVGGIEEKWEPEDVVHFRFGAPDRSNPRIAWNALSAGKREVASLNEGANYRGSILRNMGVPSHMLAPTEKAFADPEFNMDAGLAQRLRDLWGRLTKGDNRGGLLTPSFPAALTRAGFSPQELDIATMLQWDVDILCALIGVPAMLIDLPSGKEHRSYANKAEAREFFIEQTLIPLQQGVADDLTLQLLPDFGDPETERVAFDYSEVRVLQEDENKRWERVSKAVGKPFLTRDEGRTELGFDAMTPEQQKELEPTPEPLRPESSGDRAAAQNGNRPPALMNGNGKAAAVKATVAQVVDAGGAVYQYSPQPLTEIAAEEFSEVEEFWRVRSERWAGEVQDEPQPDGGEGVE